MNIEFLTDSKVYKRADSLEKSPQFGIIFWKCSLSWLFSSLLLDTPMASIVSGLPVLLSLVNAPLEVFLSLVFVVLLMLQKTVMTNNSGVLPTPMHVTIMKLDLRWNLFVLTHVHPVIHSTLLPLQEAHLELVPTQSTHPPEFPIAPAVSTSVPMLSTRNSCNNNALVLVDTVKYIVKF